MVMPEYEVHFSKRKTVRLTVERDGSVVVRAPEGTHVSEIEEVLRGKRTWIERKRAHPQKYGRPIPPGKELVAGESLLYLGRLYQINLVEKEREIALDGSFQIPRGPAKKTRDRLRDWYVEEAKRYIIPRAQEWAARLGVSPSRISIMDTRYRWGSCTPRGHIRLNWRLIKAPVHVSDYVTVHELAHLLQRDHGPAFWSIVRSHLTKVEECKRWLREQGHLLEQDL